MWLVLRQSPLSIEEEAILAALGVAAERAGARLRSVLWGTASYVADAPSTSPTGGTTDLYVLEEEFHGRGIRGRAEGRSVPATYPQIVAWLFEAEKVISFP